MKPENQSKTLTEFYKAWLDWAEGGPNVHDFDPECGLCTNLEYFNPNSEVSIEMVKQFKSANLSLSYPFNPHDDYFDEEDKRLNPSRLQWCRDHI